MKNKLKRVFSFHPKLDFVNIMNKIKNFEDAKSMLTDEILHGLIGEFQYFEIQEQTALNCLIGHTSAVNSIVNNCFIINLQNSGRSQDITVCQYTDGNYELYSSSFLASDEVKNKSYIWMWEKTDEIYPASMGKFVKEKRKDDRICLFHTNNPELLNHLEPFEINLISTGNGIRVYNFEDIRKEFNTNPNKSNGQLWSELWSENPRHPILDASNLKDVIKLKQKEIYDMIMFYVNSDIVKLALKNESELKNFMKQTEEYLEKIKLHL